MHRGRIETSRKLTAKLLLKPSGETGWIDVGELNGHKFATEVSRTPILRSQNGYRRKVFDLIDEINPRYEFLLQEDTPDAMALSILGVQGTDSTQSAVTAPEGTASFSNVKKGRAYSIGKVNLNTVIVSVSASNKTEGTDYEIDLATGTLFILPGGSITDGSTVDVTFGCAEVKVHTFTGEKQLHTTGDVTLYELDQHDDAPARTTTFKGQWYITDKEDHDGKRIAERRLVLIPISREIVQMRD